MQPFIVTERPSDSSNASSPKLPCSSTKNSNFIISERKTPTKSEISNPLDPSSAEKSYKPETNRICGELSSLSFEELQNLKEKLLVNAVNPTTRVSFEFLAHFSAFM